VWEKRQSGYAAICRCGITALPQLAKLRTRVQLPSATQGDTLFPGLRLPLLSQTGLPSSPPGVSPFGGNGLSSFSPFPPPSLRNGIMTRKWMLQPVRHCQTGELNNTCRCNSVGRVPAPQAGCREFEPRHLLAVKIPCPCCHLTVAIDRAGSLPVTCPGGRGDQICKPLPPVRTNGWEGPLSPFSPTW
jgi:hypothetical protein